MRCYDLHFKGDTPRAYAVAPIGGSSYRPDFLLPMKLVNFLGKRVEPVNQVARMTIGTFEIPDWLAREGRLDPEIDGTPAHIIAQYRPEPDAEDPQADLQP